VGGRREGGEESQEFVALTAHMQCPLVLLVKAGWQQDKALVSAEGKVLGSGVLGFAAGGREGHWGWFCVGMCSRGKRGTLGLVLCWDVQQGKRGTLGLVLCWDKVLTAWEGPCFVEGCNVGFGSQLRICCRTEKNRGKS
jgi:hypothetical protein